MTDGPHKGASRKILLWSILTFVWLAIAFYLGWQSRPATQDCTGTFSCLTANEWGDFLAGVFAPIAFLWLVATVWIQSDELREQRKELALTREEFRMNRNVMQEQAEYISTQTQLLSEESQNRKQQDTSTSFSSLISTFIRYSRENANSSFYRSGEKTSRFFHDNVSLSVSDEKYIAVQHNFLKQAISETGVEMEFARPKTFEDSFIFLYSAEELVALLPYHSRVSWKRSELSDYLNLYCEVIRNSRQFQHLRGHVDARAKKQLTNFESAMTTSPVEDD